MTSMEARRAAVRAQLDTLTELELRIFLAHLALRDVSAIEVPLAEFLATRAQVREQSAARMTAGERAWDETAQGCVCPPGLCSRRDGSADADPSGCAVCAELGPDQACYAAIVRGLRDRASQ